MGRIGKKSYETRDVWDAAVARMRITYDRFDRVFVSFSGGKDSTAVLNVAMHVARERDRLPLDVLFIDEEAIPPDTVEYVERLRARPDIRLIWSCVPTRNRNACSYHQPWWLSWNPDEQDRWCRPLPSGAVTAADRPDIPWALVKDQVAFFYPASVGSVANCTGIRTDESLLRYRAIADRGGGWITAWSANLWRVAPVYDWSVEDIWSAVHRFGWDYNTAYDKMHAMGVPLRDQRCAPPFGEEPIQRLETYRQSWPELWDKMIHRVDGAHCAAQHSRTELYGYRNTSEIGPDEGESWPAYIERLITRWPQREAAHMRSHIQGAIRYHRRKTKSATIPDRNRKDTRSRSGMSWQAFAQIVLRGDFKGRRFKQQQGRS